MFGAFTSFGKLGSLARAIAAAWSPSALWPTGTEPGMWISPSNLASQWQDSTGTTPVATPGTVADSSNPVGLALDIRAGATGEIVPVGARTNIDPGWVEGPTGTWTSNDLAYLKFALPSGVFCRVFFTLTSSGTNVIDINSGVGGGTPGTYEAVFKSTEVSLFSFGAGAVVNNIRYQEIPGNHLLQATSTARPLVSARRNLLTYTEDFSNAVWSAYEVSKTPNSGAAPDGTTTSCLVKESTSTAQHVLGGPSLGAIAAGTPCNISWYVKNAGVNYALVTFDGSGVYSSAIFDLVNGVFVRENHLGDNMYVPGSATVESIAGGYLRIAASFTPLVTGSWSTAIKLNRPNINSQDPTYEGDGTSGLYIWHPQTELGTIATPYQPILTDGSTYPSTGFPVYQKYDGTDDGMATAAFTAGALINGMDCMIPVRRDSAAACVAGLYNGIADATKFFGMAESASGSGCVGSGAGTPTVWVDGVQLSGGTAVTRGTLHTALTVGDYHILEFRGLDLSTWTAAGFGLYTSYLFHGARGDIMLYPSTTPTEDKDAARQWLADYYGVTLP